MASAATWLRTVSGALCALLLLVFSVAPAIDAVACSAEDAPSVSVRTAAGDVAVSQGHPDKAPAGKAGSEACAHGHCHHGVSAVPAVGVTLAFDVIVPPPLTPDASGVPPSNLPDGPKEPPRA